jgi:coenzyme F420 hydrogenase subunit beta
MPKTLQNIEDVVATQMCCGCGACAYIDPDRIRMVDTLDYGRRPIVSEGARKDRRAEEALAVCPGRELSHTFDRNDAALIPELIAGWGPIMEVWEGYAADPELRHAASSGGATSALSLYCLEKGGMHGVLHIAARPDVPYLNHTVMSHTRAQLLAATGSRYAPASPCDGLQRIEDAPAPCVFVGKPCDVAAAGRAAACRKRLQANLGVTIAFFCAGTPSTKGTLRMLERMGIKDPSAVTGVRYRGMGWPGKAVASVRTSNGEERRELTYEQSWGQILQEHRQWRCYVCADHTGEFADIAVGDPWYRPLSPDEPGQSLVLVRTERGRRIVHEAMASGYLELERKSPGILPASQPNLLRVRGAIWGRIWTCRLMGAAAPRFGGMPMFRFWLSELNLKEKAQAFYGTVKRVFTKRLRQRITVRPFEPSEARRSSDGG